MARIRNAWLAHVGLVLLAGSVLDVNAGAAAADPDDAIVAAFSGNAAIQQGIKEYIEQGFHEGGIQTLIVGGSCGVAGCSSTFLVVQSFHSANGPNPQSPSLLGLVTAFAGGNIVNVERVEFSVWKAPQLQMQQPMPAPPPKLEIMETSPAPSQPRPEIIDRLPGPMPDLR